VQTSVERRNSTRQQSIDNSFATNRCDFDDKRRRRSMFDAPRAKISAAASVAADISKSTSDTKTRAGVVQRRQHRSTSMLDRHTPITAHNQTEIVVVGARRRSLVTHSTIQQTNKKKKFCLSGRRKRCVEARAHRAEWCRDIESNASHINLHRNR
jgi:hypothetical protein